MDFLQRQQEDRQKQRAAEAANAARQRLKAQGNETDTEYGRAWFKAYGEPVTQSLDQLLTRFIVNPGLAGPHYAALPLLLHFKDRGITPITAVALKAVIDGVSTRRSRSRLCQAIGRAIEDEVKAVRIHEQSQDTLRLLRRHQGKGAVSAWNLKSMRVTHGPWSQVDKAEVGGLLLELVIACTGLVRVVETRRRGRRQLLVEPTEEALGVIKASAPAPQAVRHLPMLAPPRPWTGIRGGGHFAADGLLINSRHGVDTSFYQGADIKTALRVVNRLQGQQLEVDPWMLHVQQQAWNGQVRGLFPVNRDPLQAPPKPDRTATKEEWVQWRRQQQAAWTDAKQNGSARKRIEESLSECAAVAGRPIWFAYDMDFRGRVYSCNRYVTHQGPDHEKALVLFGTAPPCGEEGAEWMFKAAAGHWGLGRASWDKRLRWGRDELERLIAIAEAPLDRLELWRDAKDPWQLLQVARALRQWLQDPAAPCRVPIRMDQTTSGLGIVAALTRDRSIALHTNLIGKSPRDLYQLVADRVALRLRSDLEAGSESDQKRAALWLELGISRSLAKGPVMTLVYGAMFQGLVDQLAEHLLAAVGDISAGQYEAKVLAPSRYLARHFQSALRQEAGSGVALQNWLRDLSGAAVRKQAHLQWLSPMDFPVRLGTALPGTVKAKTLLEGRRAWLSGDAARRPGELSALATNRAVTANFVHSFDAALAHLIICRSEGQDVQVLPNHDCFAAPPAAATWLHGALHDELRVLYRVDWLTQVGNQIAQNAGLNRVPAPPLVGTLRPGEIGQNPYCFS